MKKMILPAAAIGFAMFGSDAFAQTNDIYSTVDVAGKIDTAVAQIGGLLALIIGIGFGFLAVWFGFKNTGRIVRTK